MHQNFNSTNNVCKLCMLLIANYWLFVNVVVQYSHSIYDLAHSSSVFHDSILFTDSTNISVKESLVLLFPFQKCVNLASKSLYSNSLFCAYAECKTELISVLVQVALCFHLPKLTRDND